MHDWNGDEALRFDFRQRAKDIRASHAGIDQHDHSPRFEEGERERDKLQTRTHHQNQTTARFDSHVVQAGGESIGFLVQLPKRQLRISDPAGPITSGRSNDGTLVGNAG